MTNVLHCNDKLCTPHIMEYVQGLKLQWKKRLDSYCNINTGKEIWITFRKKAMTAPRHNKNSFQKNDFWYLSLFF